LSQLETSKREIFRDILNAWDILIHQIVCFLTRGAKRENIILRQESPTLIVQIAAFALRAQFAIRRLGPGHDREQPFEDLRCYQPRGITVDPLG
jgi:hypothetical protein